ncbi:MAG: DUF4292 domain-containing protein [Ginsengibacter sp.]
MNSKFFLVLVGAIFFYIGEGCRSTKKLQTAVNTKDTLIGGAAVVPTNDSLKEAAFNLNSLASHRISFTTFSAKIKVEYADNKGKQPDFNAFVRLYSDSVLWVSISATFLSIEAFKILITKDSVIIVNKLDKQVEYHPFSYMEEVTHIPLNFSNLQDLIIGNPIYVGDSVVSYKKTENHILIATVGEFFKNLLTISADNKLIERSKLDDLNVSQNRTADITYGNYEKSGNDYFATDREITVAEKTKVDISLSFKQYEFNKDLSFPFNIPKNYKIK